MPQYKNNLTGKIQELGEDQAALYKEGTFELLSEESAREQRERLRREALENKVDLELEGDEDGEF